MKLVQWDEERVGVDGFYMGKQSFRLGHESCVLVT